jgi:hypothetical protein
VADFPITDQAWMSPPEQGDLDPQHNSRTWTYRLWHRAVRSIGNRPLLPSLQGSRDVSVGCDPHTKVVNESVHIRAIRRLGTQVLVDGQKVLYAPTNQICCLPELRRIYQARDPVHCARYTHGDGNGWSGRAPTIRVSAAPSRGGIGRNKKTGTRGTRPE